MVGRAITILILASFLVGCASNPNNPDPWEKTNRVFYRFNEGLDRILLKPAADFYVTIMPAPVRTGIANGFDNLTYGDVILNDFLQGKWGQGLADSWRMTLNSTFGVAGILDIATREGFPEHDNHFGVTLTKWGFKPGPYVVVPLFGPTTVRDAPDFVVGRVTNPLFWIDVPTAASIGLGVTQIVDNRSRYEGAMKFMNAAALDPYIFMREAYLAYRRHLAHPEESSTESDMYDEPPAQPATQSTTP